MFDLQYSHIIGRAKQGLGFMLLYTTVCICKPKIGRCNSMLKDKPCIQSDKERFNCEFLLIVMKRNTDNQMINISTKQAAILKLDSFVKNVFNNFGCSNIKHHDQHQKCVGGEVQTAKAKHNAKRCERQNEGDDCNGKRGNKQIFARTASEKRFPASDDKYNQRSRYYRLEKPACAELRFACLKD